MPLTLDQQTALKQIQKQVDTFEVGKTRVRAPDMTPVYFAEGKLETLARRLGDLFWLPTERANRIFLYAYSALFGIPTFTAEALARMPDRFSEKRLPLTIRSTSSFILDGFGFDRRVERTRDLVYWPGPAIRSAHAETRQGKHRISNPAMAYFGYHLIQAAEKGTPECTDADREQHYDYIGDFFRTAGYPFPKDRQQAETFVQNVDQHLAGDEYAHLWHHIFRAADVLNTTLHKKQLADFLLEKTSSFFAETTDAASI